MKIDSKALSISCLVLGLVLGSKEEFPSVEQAYPGVFEDLVEKKQDELQEKKDELSALRFRQFAQSYNNKFVK